jgi:hypothetical protein
MTIQTRTQSGSYQDRVVRINTEATFRHSRFELGRKHELGLTQDNNYSNYSVKNAKELEKLLDAWQK